MKKVFYFFPLNPAESNSGSCTRALELLRYFKAREFSVDFVSQEDWGKWTLESKKKFLNLDLADNLYVLKRKPPKDNALKYFFSYKLFHLLYRLRLPVKKNSFPNHATLLLQNSFDRLFRQNSYDLVIISYAYWASLVIDNPFVKNTFTILDTHDVLSIQHRENEEVDFESASKDELSRLSSFDQVWAIAPRENEYFQKNLSNDVRYIPVSLAEPVDHSVHKEFDIIYVATDNPHNIRGAKWFFEQVYPVLKQQYNILVIGGITSFVPRSLQNVKCVAFAEDLSKSYSSARVALCPMFSGTGVKVKVVEAFAYGLPVVCTERGLDGLPADAETACLISDDSEQFARNLQLVLEDSKLYQELSTAGKETFSTNFSRQSVYRRLDDALAKVSS